MAEILEKFRPDELVGMVALVLTFLAVTSPVIALCWYKIHKNRMLAALKQDMLDRGMSADEIKTVLEAGVKK